MTRTREDVAWLAGLYEGEGSAYVKVQQLRDDRRGPYVSQSLRITMTDEDVVRHAHGVAGLGHVYGPAQPKNLTHKPTWSLAAASFEEAQAFAAMIWPWLGTRRKAQIRRVFERVERGHRDRYRGQFTMNHFGKRHRDLDEEERREFSRLWRAERETREHKAELMRAWRGKRKRERLEA